MHRGFDPRDFHRVGFGGAGPMHVFLVAEELGIRNVLIPLHPGHLSAYGQILAGTILHLVAPLPVGQVDDAALAAALAGLKSDAAVQFAADGLDTAELVFEVQADARYKGQSFTIAVGADAQSPNVVAIAEQFHSAMRRPSAIARRPIRSRSRRCAWSHRSAAICRRRASLRRAMQWPRPKPSRCSGTVAGSRRRSCAARRWARRVRHRAVHHSGAWRDLGGAAGLATCCASSSINRWMTS